MALPFHKGERSDWFPEFQLPYKPWRHQEQAFARLSPGSPQNTLVATGTGSGKTECFLLPCLEHCRQARRQGQLGIKVLILYPMNALATDQAKRIAHLIHTTPALAGLRAGLYIGDKEELPSIAMGPERVITDRATLHKAPPDLLLTNYKQLDYLLLQPHVQGLWAHNGPNPDGPSVLRYLVVDEFHTFDGAQGTDLACLIRRLRHRLSCQGEQLLCVGTSATLGDSESQGEMLHYAAQIFGGPFGPDALIQESRQTPAQFFHATAYGAEGEQGGLLVRPLPTLEQQAFLDPASFSARQGGGDPEGIRQAYLLAQVPLWLGEELPPPASGDAMDPAWRIALGRQLGRLPAVQNLILQAQSLCSFDDLLERFARQLGLDGRYPLAFRHQLLASLLALMAHARATDGQPWVHVRVQLWLRELKRMVASVASTPELLHSDDLQSDGGHHLPVVHCRDCGATGWVSTLLHSTAHQLDPARNLRAFYRAFFARDPLIRYVFPQRPLPSESTPLELAADERLFCQACLSLQEPPPKTATGAAAAPSRSCQSCDSPNLLVVRVPEITRKDANNHLRSSSDCPFCQAPQSLLLIGASAASLTSACASALFASSFNTDRKLLTFSDSVQDAAHRAGFIAARAYRTSFRTALTRTMQAAGRDLSLPELQDALLAHWHQALPNPVDFVATFLPTDMEWLKDWAALEESRQPTLASDSPLVGLVEKRLRWEVIAEFGYRSRLGSSVEQAGALAVTSLPPEHLESLVQPLLAKLRNEVEALRSLEDSQLRHFLVGWLHHLRQRGALPTPELLGGVSGQGSRYLSSLGSDTFGFKLIHHLPNVGPTSNRPLFLASSRGRGVFEALVSRKGRPTWAMAWLARTTGLSLPEPVANQPARAEPFALALRLILDALEACGLLLPLPSGQGGEQLWGLDPALVRVSAATTALRCDTCQDGQTVPQADQAVWEAMPCLVAGCDGHYRPDPEGGLPLYRRLYRNGAVRRILAREHTGLLPRADRERLEFQFIHDGPLSHPNLLSATSTLEMGINIGDLSSLLLCSVPPEPANYLQRIGRAGRRDGNALVATIVNATPHDLYFYGEPNAMLQGRISPPGCYLDAAAILARQLVAFSLDRWVQSGIANDDLPRQLKSVLDTLAINNWDKKRQRFPFNWLRWTRDHQRALLGDFLDLFAGDTVGAACREQLAARFLAPDPQPEDGEERSAEWAVRLLDRLGGHSAERKRLNREGSALNKRRQTLEAIPPASRLTAQSDDLEAIQRELEALGELRKALENRPLLQDLTDGGLLPNYAFPEEGVTLQTVLWRRLTQKSRSGRSSETLHPPSYERPGSVAIRELVPEGVFYAQGRRLRIDQIDLSLNPIQRWRFCRACSACFQEGEEGFHSPVCPSCGDANFSDVHQVKEMARLRQVIASGDDALSRISDDRDDRTPTFFQRQLLVIPDLHRVEVTLAVNDGAFPFGVEYISSTTFREINFGALNPLGSGHQIAGAEFRVRGFEICSACGKVLKGEPQSRQHAYSCRYRDDPGNAKARQLLFLYRDFSSEALRFLLPDRLFWDEAGQSSFQAALQLGLKRHFSGRVDHLQATIATEPQPSASPGTGGSQQRKTFLYLYDSVPGGTGYLRQLVEGCGERLHQVLTEAAVAMQACPCHDGCYRCLYAYRRRFERDRTSKARALEQGQLLSEHWPKLRSSARSLTSLTITTQAESELEERFLDALREGKGAMEGERIRLTADTWKGKPAWRLQVGACGWILQTQVEIGPDEGVAVPSRCDFLLMPTAGGLPVAVYTDGWEFHHDRLALDARQRLALQRSGRFRFWSLTWADVVDKTNGPADPLPRNGLLQGLNATFRRDPAAFAEHWLSAHRLGAGNQELAPDPRWLQESNSLQWLLAYLRLPSESLRERVWQGLAHTLCLAQGWKDLRDGLPAGLQEQLDDLGLLSHLHQWRDDGQTGQAGAWLEQAPGLMALNCVDLQAHRSHREEASLRVLHLHLTPQIPEPDQPLVWREWLRQGNLFQFLPHMLLTTEGFSGFDAPSVPWSSAVATPSGALDGSDPARAPKPAPSDPWGEALTFAQSYALAALPLLSALQPPLDAMGIEPPEFSHEVAGSRGETLAELPMAWPSQRIAVIADDQNAADLPLEGWRCFGFQSAAAELLEAFSA
ncbi:MAG: DEAD/DEAH box helicase [Cyanobacteriota bacterium]|nr:DEAD/DEAH box helicase [Cyanobacteriota bacterium]